MRRPSIIHTQSPNYTWTLMYVNLSWTLLNNLNDTCVSNVWLIRPEQTRNAREAEGWCTCKLKYMPLFTSFISVYRRVSCHLLRFWKHFFYFNLHKCVKQEVFPNCEPCVFLFPSLPACQFITVKYCLYAPRCCWHMELAMLSATRRCMTKNLYIFLLFVKAISAEKLGLCYLRCIAVKGSALQWISIG